MTKVDHLRNEISNRVLNIRDERFLRLLNDLISSHANSEAKELSPEQEMMLKLSEKDIQDGRLISQEDLQTKTKKWLRERKD